MTQIVRSGAFLQQCWSVHPLCVMVKRMGDDRRLVLSCSSCKSGHYLTVGLVTPKDSTASDLVAAGQIGQEVTGEELLSACITTHRSAITLRVRWTCFRIWCCCVAPTAVGTTRCRCQRSRRISGECKKLTGKQEGKLTGRGMPCFR
jgi:hypothetical protein